MDQTSQNNRGSQWRKWDLQVHTPFSHLNNGFGSDFDEYVKKLFKTAIEKQIAVIGVTDYFCIEGYKKIKQEYLADSTKLAKLFTPEEIAQIQRITLFPNVEFRLDTLVNDNRVNFHVIFSDEVSITDIEENFLHELDFVYEGNPQNTDEKWKLKIANLETLGRNLKSEHTTFQSESDLFVGMKCAVVHHTQITDLLVNKKSKFEGKYLLCVPADEDLSRISWDGQDHNVRKVYIQKSDALISSNAGTISWGLGEKHESTKAYVDEFKSLKPCIWGSDCHNYDSLFEPSEKRYTWIKSDPTFEGLKQITYEPKLRVHIGEIPPSHSPNTIDYFSFKIPADARVGDDEFCFSGLEQKFYLNPYLNCFVGGRGTGKSTILNFFGLRSIHPSSSENFWKWLKPEKFNPLDEGAFSIEGTEIFEFLGQSEVETFAKDKSRFTEAIYDRANSRSGNELEKFELSIENYQSRFDGIIQAIFELSRLEEQRLNLEKEKRTLEKGKEVISSDEYIKLAGEITKITKELQSLSDWRHKIENLRGALESLYSVEQDEDNQDWFDEEFGSAIGEIPLPAEGADADNDNTHITTYSDAYQSVITKIKEAESELNSSNFVEALNEEDRLRKAIDEKENQAKIILENAGLSEENVAQIKSAPKKITELEHQISRINDEIEAKKLIIKKYDNILEDTSKTKQNYEEQITSILTPLQGDLEGQFIENEGRDIQKISLTYSFSEEKAWEAVAKEFYRHFKDTYGDGEQETRVAQFICNHSDVFGKDDLSAIQSLLAEEASSQKYIGFLSEVFQKPNNFKVFCCIRSKHLYDVKRYKLIQVKYGDRDIENASFGQRCTAVIVVLLLFGNYPLIIDEPEAHLDSSLIANYLVPLLKKKKPDRQIIFATHNANFVINGDAEKIFILETPDKKTTFIETTIENLEHREKLLKLEGGEEAFESRRKKYHLKH